MTTTLSAPPQTTAADAPAPQSSRNPREDAFAADEGQIRHDLVIRVRRQIELGIYEEDKRIDALLDRLMADLGVD